MSERPPAAKPPLMRMILLGMTVLPWVVLLGVGVRLLVGDSLLGFVLVAIGSVSLALSVRRVRAELSPADPEGGLASAEYDYIIWAMVGMPFLMVALALVLLATGGLRTT